MHLSHSKAMYLTALLSAGLFGACSSGGSSNGDGGAGGAGSDSSDGDLTLKTDGGGQNNGGGSSKDCGGTTVEAGKTPVNMVLLIDKSGSMSVEAEFGQARWDAMKLSLGEALGSVQEDMQLGLQLFPFAESSSDSCAVPANNDLNVEVAPGKESLPLILQAFDAHAPDGGTPTAAALLHVLDYYTQGKGKNVEGHRYVLLATDGGPNCDASESCEASQCTQNIDNKCPAGVANCCALAPKDCLDSDGTVAAVKALADKNIYTFVVGIPGSDTEEYVTVLNQMAQHSGAASPDSPPDYYRVEAEGGVAGLTEVLQSITTRLITECDLQLESEPPTKGLLNVVIDGEKIPPDPDNGWALNDDTSPSTIELRGTTCDEIEKEGAEKVTITYGCPTVDLR